MSDSFCYKPLTIYIAVWNTNSNDGVCVFKADSLFFSRKWENNVWRITRKRWRHLPYWRCWWCYLAFKKLSSLTCESYRVRINFGKGGEFSSISWWNWTRLAVCPKHRHHLGKYWQPLRTCQCPQHEGRKTALYCRNPVNWTMAQEIKDMFNTPVQVGSRKLSYAQFSIYDILTFNKFHHRWVKYKKAKQTRQKQIKTRINEIIR